MNKSAVDKEVRAFMRGLKRRNPGEREFHQAVEEVALSVMPFILENTKYHDARILERMTEPDRILTFRVCWEDDEGNVRVNRGHRVQFNNSIGPYKGGLRFHHSVNISILKFLGFEQTFKNSLTSLPLGAAKGGANFNPHGKSDREIMRFCQAFMVELSRHIGPSVDVPAGDIGVGAREIGYLFGQYKKIRNDFVGVLTGKGIHFGGSLIRTEATGYGAVYFCREALVHKNDDLKDKVCAISGSGNVAQYTAEKLLQLGAKVVTLSDSGGSIYIPEGISTEQLEWLKDLKNNRRGRISEFAERFDCVYLEEKRPWSIKCDLAFPCATQNEIEIADAEMLVNNGVLGVVEGANMPSTLEAVSFFRNHDVMFLPAKAANAGGVAISGLEMTQNSMRLQWTREEVNRELEKIMKHIHRECVRYGEGDGKLDYVKGANVAGFVKVADAMLSYGVL